MMRLNLTFTFKDTEGSIFSETIPLYRYQDSTIEELWEAGKNSKKDEELISLTVKGELKEGVD